MRTAAGSILFLAVAAIAQQSASVWDGVYVEAQAGRGKALFHEQCAQCHGEALAGKNGPPLTGAVFKGNWNGLTADDLFEYIKKSMPRGQAGTLTREQTADIVAFMLNCNGFPAGQKDMPNDASVLRTVRFEADKPGAK
jgi:mono/diheme cytochrome c family protein